MKLSFSKEMYPKIALIKAAYAFTDKAYVHLDADQSYYLVQIVPKENNCLDIEKLFENEMLCQCIRHEVYLQTKGIRELLTARAMASTVLEMPGADQAQVTAGPDPESDILIDWFEKYDHTTE